MMRWGMTRALGFVWGMVLFLGLGAGAQGRFYLRDGDRVVFYGDSITDQRLYTTYIETYCVTRFPRMRLTFTHSGWGGDRVTGGGGGPIDVRLKRDVLAYRPTVVTICLGMNDGGYRAFALDAYGTYVRGLAHIVETLQKELPGVRITLLTAPAYDDVTRPPGFPGGYNSTLTAYGEAVRDLGRRLGLTVADTNAPLVATLARARVADADLAAKIIPDRVHPQHGGHLVMAAAVLKAWNAPADVAEFTADAGKGRVEGRNSVVSDVKFGSGGVSFRHTDRCLPWAFDRDMDKDKDTGLVLECSNIERSLNRFLVRATGLSGAQFILKEDGRAVGRYSRDELEAGVDLAGLPHIAETGQDAEVLGLTRKHNDLHFRRWRELQVPNEKNGATVSAEIRKRMDDLDAEDARTAAAARAAAAPKTHTFEIVPG